ncbi:hypothetical protein PFICI_14118 [Pestalotiopsis fici W106-1]|uniref:Uncharacterized protein n=1 Tax=Pestalotiopsis fici (strain W106-1 / CGMCC3.15140) TaxID=1229662 RepID=W3WM88_PESFW|nr:uncharacterized protein PFICI_14118 [Pestalotiopsis fici W106-1]ETS74252.1 hypothetical protein PFICI_14118 [Pestalotiopsis fici W106-1]
MPLRRRPGRFIEATEPRNTPTARHQGIASAPQPTEQGEAWRPGDGGGQQMQIDPQGGRQGEASRTSDTRPAWHSAGKPARQLRSSSNGGDPGDEESLRYLIEFLRRTPPPGNHMSIPDDAASIEGSRWRRALNPFRRKSRRRPGPITIQLPDSAVASTTSGGYRHIAISIPVEHSYASHGRRQSRRRSTVVEPLEQESTHDIEERLGVVETRLASLRPYSSDQGAGTVLQPVAEAREPKPISAREAPPRPPRTSSMKRPSSSRVHRPARDSGNALPLDATPPPKQTRPHATGLGPAARRPSEARSTAEESGARRRPQPIVIVPDVTPTLARQTGRIASSPRPKSNVELVNQPQADDGKDLSSQGSSSQAGTPITPAATSDIGLKLPPRKTSKRSTFGGQRSIPGLLSPSFSQKSSPGAQSSSAYGNNPPSPEANILRPRIGSVVTIDSEPRVMDAQAATAHRAEAVPLVLGDSAEASAEPSSSTDGATSSPLHSAAAVSRSAQTDITTMHHLHKALSRKEKVRQRKHMDLHSNRKGKTSQDVFFSDAPPSSTASHHLRRVSSVSDQTDTRPIPIRSRIPHTAKADQSRPSTAIPRIPSAGQSEAPTNSPVSILKPSRQASMGSFRSSTTTSSSSSFVHSFDRLSSLRQIQRRIERDVRTTREALDGAGARAEATSAPLNPEQLQRRHEYLRERRLRDVERRIRRIERNGDLWLRSLPGLLETLGKMEEHWRHASQQQQQPQPLSRPVNEPPSPATTRTRATSHLTSAGTSDYSPESLEPLISSLQEVAKLIPVSPRPRQPLAEPTTQRQRAEDSFGAEPAIPERAPERIQKGQEATRLEAEERARNSGSQTDSNDRGAEAGIVSPAAGQMEHQEQERRAATSPVYHLAPETPETAPEEAKTFSLWW